MYLALTLFFVISFFLTSPFVKQISPKYTINHDTTEWTEFMKGVFAVGFLGFNQFQITKTLIDFGFMETRQCYRFVQSGFNFTIELNTDADIVNVTIIAL